jgi:superfamily I DNA and/or RNA helicase
VIENISKVAFLFYTDLSINQSKNLMNVAVSRAKDSFLVFGDSGCLVGDEKTAAGLLKEITKNIE